MFAKKSLGQHFLNSPTALQKIVSAAQLAKDDLVLEIGPGRGALTRALLNTDAQIVAIEKDEALVAELSQIFAVQIAAGKLQVLSGDILETNLESIFHDRPYKLVANIPYYITGLILRKFLSAKEAPTSMTLLVQKEVALRIIGKEKLSDRGIEKVKQSILSISVAAYGTPIYIDTVPKGAFLPPPKVDSAILQVKNISKTLFTQAGISEETFFKIVSAGFAQKRKKLFNNLKKISQKENRESTFATCGIPLGTRAEELSVDDWFCVARELLT